MRSKMNPKTQIWYVLIHTNPEQAEWMLKCDNEGAFLREGEEPKEAVSFFIPYQFLQRVPSDQRNAEAYNSVRQALHKYVFVFADEERVNSIVESEWNRNGRLQMRLCRSKSGEPLRIADNEMQMFIETLRNRQLKYYIGQPIESMEAGDKVTLRMHPWEGHSATVTRVEVHNGHTCLTVSLDILGNLTRVSFNDVHEGDVSFDDDNSRRLMTGNLLHNFESDMVTLLGRRFGKKSSDDDRRHDHSLLTRLYAYAGTQFDNEDDYRRFTALMLLCAVFLDNKEDRERYVGQLREWLSDKTEATTATEAYLMTALFVATRDPALREAVKRYKNSHTNCPEIILRLFAKVKRIHTR